MARMSNLLEQVKSIEEGFASDAQRRAAFASGYKEKGKKKKEEEAVSPAQQAAIAISKKEKAKKEGIELDEYLTADEKKLIAKMYDKKGNLTPLGKKVMDYKIKKEEVEENTLDIENESDYTLDEGKMKELHGYISSGKSAEQIAKIMKLDVKTIKALMKEETDIDELSLSVKDIQKSGVRKQDTSKLKKDLAKLKKGLKKEDTEIDESMEDEFGEKFQSRRPGTDTVNKAIAIAKKMSGNMTGAVKAIEKIRDGLSKYPEVANAVRMANEEFELDEKAPKIGVDRLKQQRDKDKDHADAMGRHVKSGRRKSRKEDVELDEASMKIGSIDFELFTDMKGSKQANAAMNKEIAKAAKMKDYKSARTYMNKVQDKYQKFGAGDSEPERTIDAVLAKSFSNDPDRRKHSFDFRREDVEVIDGYFQETKSSTGYELFHRDFSSAMQHAYDHAKKKFGITIDKDEIDDKVAMGPRKPSKGKTNSYRLKGDKGNIQVQVYNMGSRFELNMYKEEVEEAFDPADFDIKATGKDKEQADQNILIQLQKVISLRGMKPVEFANGSKQKVDPNIAAAALSMHQRLRRTDEKDAFQRKIGKSYRDLLNAVKGRK